MRRRSTPLHRHHAAGGHGAPPLGDGRTRLRGRSIGRTVEGRDAMVESGMEHGMAEGYERLEALVATDAAAG